MKPIEGFDTAPAYTGESIQLPAGAYKCIIKQVNVTMDKNNREIMVVLFDIAEGPYKDFYMKRFESAKKSSPDAKWSGTYRQLTQGDSLPFFKGLITSIEKSNPGYKWNWDEASLKGKLFGGVFRREEFMSDTGVKMATKCIQARSLEGLADVKVPGDKLLSDSSKTPPAKASSASSPYGMPGADGFMNIPDGIDEELPFM